MPRALDLLAPTGKHFLPAPTTPGLDIPPDPFVRERGASNLNLLDSGRAQIHKAGQGFAKALANAGRPRQVKIYTSPWARTKETSQILAQHLGAFTPTIHEVPELAPQSQGGLEGERSDDAREMLKNLKITSPHNEPPGESKFTGEKGESQHSYESRLLPAIHSIMQESERHPSLVSIIAAHSGDMRTVRAWAEAGFPKDYHSLERSTLEDTVGHGSTDRLSMDQAGKWNYERGVGPSAHPGVYLQRHGDTEFNTPRPGMLASARGRGERTGTVESYRDNPTNPSASGNSSGTPPTPNQY